MIQNDYSARRMSNSNRREVNQSSNRNNTDQNIDFYDGELSQLDHSSNYQRHHHYHHHGNQNQSQQFANIYFTSVPMREYIKLVILDEFTKPIVQKDNENVVQNIREVMKNIFTEIEFHENSLLVCNNSLRNRYFIYFHNCDTQPFSSCCKQPVFIELDKLGRGNIKCNSSPSLCPNQSNLGKYFQVNINDPFNKNSNYGEEEPMNQKQINKKYSKEISRRVVNGSYKVFNIQERIKNKNKEIKQFIDQDIYQSNAFQAIQHNSSINSIDLKSISNTLVDLSNASLSILKLPRQQKDYYANYIQKIDISSLNVDNLVKEESENDDDDNNFDANQDVLSYQYQSKSHNQGFKSNQGYGVKTTSQTKEQFIPKVLRKRLLTPQKVQKREVQQNGEFPSSKLSAYPDIQPLKDIQYTKEYKTLQRIRKRIQSVTGHSPIQNRVLENQQSSYVEGSAYNVLNDYKLTQHLKTQLSGSFIGNMKKLNTSTDNQNHLSQHQSDYSKKQLTQPITSDLTNYTHQILEYSNNNNINYNQQQSSQIRQLNKSQIHSSKQTMHNSQLADQHSNSQQKQYLIKHSFTPQMYNDYRIIKNDKNSPKSQNNHHIKPSLTPISPRTANDHNKMHVFKSVLRKQLKPYKDMSNHLGAAPVIQLNQIGNYRSAITTQKSIIQTLI